MGFWEYVLSCHNRYSGQADVGEHASALDGSFDIVKSYTSGDLDHQVDICPIF